MAEPQRTCDGGILSGRASQGRREMPRTPGAAPPAAALPKEGGLLDDTLNWLLLDCTVVAVQDTEEVAEEVAITTLLASMKASWKLYRHFLLAALLFSLQSRPVGEPLLGGGRASGLVSENAGPKTSLPSETKGRMKASGEEQFAKAHENSQTHSPHWGCSQ